MPTWRAPRSDPKALPQPALFVDRDGVVVAERDYLSDPDGVVVLPGVAGALASARAAGFLLIGITNQSGIGRGYYTTTDFAAVMTRLDELLAEEGARFDAFFYCPHGPRDGCACRKPRPGLLEEAALVLPSDPSRSWVIGDKESDIELGQEAGLGAVLVRTGYGAAHEAKVAARWSAAERFFVAADLAAAVDRILAGHRGVRS